jgi:hypothetical protein
MVKSAAAFRPSDRAETTQARVPLAAITGFEAAVVTPRPTDLAAIQAVLKRAGVEFIEGNGVRLSMEERERRIAADPQFVRRKPSRRSYVIGGMPPPAKRKG